jgi:hypothetical protein
LKAEKKKHQQWILDQGKSAAHIMHGKWSTYYSRKLARLGNPWQFLEA